MNHGAGLRPAWMAGVGLLVVLALPLARPTRDWLQEGGELRFVTYNATRTYRVEFYNARRWQRLLYFSMDDPGFVRLVDNCDPARFRREGGVVEFEGGGNGDVIWLEHSTGWVSIGVDTHFEDVPPLSPDCRVLEPEFARKHGGD